ncbi:MAG TPA: A/G-specific adenine glycosylase [Candidatus Eisenbacteria bacterium]|nr:A/G-specific adenine glycosylase [Candidatus Eisenbacteria bacterium]
MNVRGRLLRWYRRHKREMPWRETRDPYAIWVSEIMLQQTRVETVIPFYHRFLERFPTVEALARAKESDVLARWSGLGYYRRAKNLRAAAAVVAREHGGRVPSSIDALLELPGIGPYTAAAIASIAYGVPAAAVDGNVIRVIARWEGLEGSRDDARLRREVTARAEALAPGPDPGDWTQALMELGATICLPREPLCERCPVAGACVARASGRPDRFPDRGRTAAVRVERRVLLLLRRRSRVLLVPDPLDGGATLAPPSAIVTNGRSAARVARALGRAHGAAGDPLGPTRTFRHQTYSHDYTIEVWEADAARDGSAGVDPREGSRWSALADLPRLPLRATTLKALGR